MTLDRKRCGVKKLCVVRACQRRELGHMHASALLKQWKNLGSDKR